MNIMHEPLFSATAIRDRVAAIAAQINQDYAGRSLDVVSLCNGGWMFTADLLRLIEVPTRLHQLGFSSYGASNVTGEVRLTLDIAEPLYQRDVLVIEGLIISGRTPRYVVEMLKLREPASIALCAVGVKRHMLAVELPIAYAAFELGDEQVIGYGIGAGPEKGLPFLGLQRGEPK